MIVNLNVGDTIYNKRNLNNTMIQHWKFGSYCENYKDGFVSGTKFEIVELNRIPGNMWVKAKALSDAKRVLKISGEEYANNFGI